MKSPGAFPFQKIDIDKRCLVRALIFITVITIIGFLPGSFIHKAVQPILTVSTFLRTAFFANIPLIVSVNNQVIFSETGIGPAIFLLLHWICTVLLRVAISVEIALNLPRLKKTMPAIKLTGIGYELLTLFTEMKSSVIYQQFLCRRIGRVIFADQQPCLYNRQAAITITTKPSPFDYMISTAGAGCRFEIKGKK